MPINYDVMQMNKQAISLNLRFQSGNGLGLGKVFITATRMRAIVWRTLDGVHVEGHQEDYHIELLARWRTGGLRGRRSLAESLLRARTNAFSPGWKSSVNRS